MLRNLSMKQKNLAAFCLIACVSVVAGAITFQQTLEVDHAADEASKVRTSVERVRQLESQVTEQALILKDFILTGDRQYLQSALEANAIVDQAAAALIDAMSASDLDSEAKDVDRAIASYRRWRDEHVQQVISLMRDPATIDLARAIEASGQGDQLLNDFSNAAEALTEVWGENSDAAQRMLFDATSLSQMVVVVSTIMIALIALLLGMFNWRLLSQMTESMAALARGELAIDVSKGTQSQELKAMAEATEAKIKSGELHPFTGPVARQDGSEWLKAGEKADDGTLLGMNFYVQGVDDKLPQ